MPGRAVAPACRARGGVLQGAGESVVTVAEWLGRSSPSITLGC